MNNKWLTALISLILFTSCGKSSANNEKKNNLQGVNRLSIGQVENYESDCYKITQDAPAPNAKSQLEMTMISDVDVLTKVETTLYSDNCEFPLTGTHYEAEGKLSQNNTLLEATLTILKLRPLTEEMTQYFNQELLCGHNDWELMSYKNLFDTSCFEGSKDGDFHLEKSNNEEVLTIHGCERGDPQSEKCETIVFKKI